MKVAVVGATGAVGREILKTLSERAFPAREVIALASERSLGKSVSFGEDDVLKVDALVHYDFHGTDLALFSAGSACSKTYAPRAVEAGCVVIDNSSAFRLDPNVSLVVPEVNAGALPSKGTPAIVSNPNCVAIPLVMALKPLKDLAGIKRVVVSTYQSVSGKGRRAMDELFRQTKSIMVGGDLAREEFPKQIAFNLFPHVDSFQEDGSTFEEWKVRMETWKMLGEDIPLAVTCVRVPVFIGHSLAVSVAFDQEVTPSAARAALAKMPGVQVLDRIEDEQYITPVEASGEDAVFVSRIRQDSSVPHGLLFWISADNLRKGAALNAVQIAEKIYGRA